MSTWPPSLADFRHELKRDVNDTVDSNLLQGALDASVAFVERIHCGRYSFGDLVSLLPDVPADMRLGTLYLARRIHNRRKTPDGIIDLGESGSARIPSFDPEIDRMLRIGRYRRSVIA